MEEGGGGEGGGEGEGIIITSQRGSIFGDDELTCPQVMYQASGC